MPEWIQIFFFTDSIFYFRGSQSGDSLKKELLYKYFSDDDFLRISSKIKEVEKKTSGELRVTIKEKKEYSARKLSLKDYSSKLFEQLGMKSTRDSTGILFVLVLSERQFYIFADDGINKKVEQSVWDSIRDSVQLFFRNGDFCEGILDGLGQAGEILSAHFPIKIDDTNELSNSVAF